MDHQESLRDSLAMKPLPGSSRIDDPHWGGDSRWEYLRNTQTARSLCISKIKEISGLLFPTLSLIQLTKVVVAIHELIWNNC